MSEIEKVKQELSAKADTVYVNEKISRLESEISLLHTIIASLDVEISSK